MRTIGRIALGARNVPSHAIAFLRNPDAAWERILDRVHGPATTPGDLRMRESFSNQVLVTVFGLLPGTIYFFMKAYGFVDR